MNKPINLLLVLLAIASLVLAGGCTKPAGDEAAKGDAEKSGAASESGTAATGGAGGEPAVENSQIEQVVQLEQEKLRLEQELLEMQERMKEKEKDEAVGAKDEEASGGVFGMKEEEPVDTDSDGVMDDEDNCVEVANKEQMDSDKDGFGDVCDADSDGDGVPNDSDNCPLVANAQQEDGNEDGGGDACDPDKDWDKDKIFNEDDNCPKVANADQADFDGDKAGDACDEDVDGDKVANEEDSCPYYPNPDQDAGDLDAGGGMECDNEVDGLVSTLLRFPLEFAVKAPEKLRLQSLYAVALMNVNGAKQLLMGDLYGNLLRAYLDEAGGIDKWSSVTFGYAAGIAVMPNQKVFYIASYVNYLNDGAFSTVWKGTMDAGGNIAVARLKKKDGTDIRYNINTEYNLLYATRPAVSPDGRYLYLPLYGRKGNASVIQCAEVNPDTGDVLDGPKNLINAGLSLPSGLAVAGIPVGNDTQNYLYITDRGNLAIYRLKVNGCGVPDGAGLELMAEKAGYAMGIDITRDHRRLYYTTFNTNVSAVMTLALREDGLPAGAPTIVAGSLVEYGWRDGTNPRFFNPYSLALDEDAGRIYVADTGNGTVKLLQLNQDMASVKDSKNLIGVLDLTAKEKKLLEGMGDSYRFGYGMVALPPKDGIVNIYATSSAYTINHFRFDVEKGIVVSAASLAGTPYVSRYSNLPPMFSDVYDLAFSNPPVADKAKEKWYLYAADYGASAIRCINLKPSTGEFKKVVSVVSGSSNKVWVPRGITVSDDGRFVYFTNLYNVTGAGAQYGGSNISYIRVDPETCYPADASATVMPETYKEGLSMTGGISYQKFNGKPYLYFTTYGGNENQLKRLELDPETGGLKNPGAAPEVVAGAGPSSYAEGNPKAAMFGTLWDIAFTADKKHVFMADMSSNSTVWDVLLNGDGTAKYVAALAGNRTQPRDIVDGLGSNAVFVAPYSLVVLPVGKDGLMLWVMDASGGAIREVR